MPQIIRENEYNLGFKIKERRCSRASAVIDLSYADDIALISKELYEAQELLHIVEIKAGKIEVETLEKQKLTSDNYLSETIKEVSNYKYLGAWIANSEKYFEIRKALTWTVIHRMKFLWASNMRNK